MKERPILFSAPMVRALLDGSKTQTRRLVQPYQHANLDRSEKSDLSRAWSAVAQRDPRWGFCVFGATEDECMRRVGEDGLCPYGRPGDRLWVRETWADLEQITDGSFARQAIYRADDIEQYGDEDEFVDVTSPDMRWRPSIHMPRWASRILLEVVSVRVERLNAISADDCRAEGIGQCDGLGTNVEILDLARRMVTYTDESLRYATLWEQINGAGSWDANPWVWVVEFKRGAA